MAALRRFLLRLRNAVAPGRAERELSREVASHLAILEEQYKRDGLTGADARLAARRAIGGIEQAKDRQRDARSFVWIDDLRRDAGYALRTMVRTPIFTGVAILTLALSIGANTAILSVVDHVLWRPLPLPHSDRLVRLYESNPPAGRPRVDAASARAEDWRRAAASFDLLATMGGTNVTMTGAAEPESLSAMLVGPEYFEISGVRLALGRPFESAEYTAIANAALRSLAIREPVTGRAAVILSHSLWLRQFDGDPNVVGRTVRMNGIPAEVAGVMPADWRFDESASGAADCWIPHVPSRMMAQRRYRFFRTIARLKPGVTLQQAQVEMTGIAAALERQYPKDDAGWTVRVEPYQKSLNGELRPTLLILFAGVVCVLLVACASIANLFLVRAAGRTREVAVRLAIGAGRARLVRQWLTESTVLALAGGLAGFLISLWAVPALVANAPISLPRLGRIEVDARILVFNIGISLVTGLLCGLAPAIGTRRVSVSAMRTAGVASGRGRKGWLRPSLLVVQIGLAVVLLVGAGLMGRTLMAVYGLELGFNPDRVLTFQVAMRGPRYEMLGDVRNFMQRLSHQLQTLNGVEAAGVGGIPLGGLLDHEFLVEGRSDTISSHLNAPGSGYFKAVGLRLEAGRVFEDRDDRLAEGVAVVNEAFARAAWGTTDAVGRRLREGEQLPWRTVVGVVDDVRVGSLEAPSPPIVFMPYMQATVATYSYFVVRTSGDPYDAVPLVRHAVRSLDPEVALTGVTTLEEKLSKAIAPRLFNAWLIGLFSVIALILAVVGVYGLISETVASRTPEIGVRMALGATRRQVVRLVVGTSLGAMAIGVTIGLAGAAVAARSLGTLIFGVPPIDPVTLVVMPVTFIAIAALASLAPARRATRIDPVMALRND
jgi:putative ABC transport system permease protein